MGGDLKYWLKTYLYMVFAFAALNAVIGTMVFGYKYYRGDFHQPNPLKNDLKRFAIKVERYEVDHDFYEKMEEKMEIVRQGKSKSLQERDEEDETSIPCVDNFDCPSHSECEFISRTEGFCKCEDGYITTEDSGTCGYRQKDQLVLFLLSLFLGELGVDWYYMSEGDGGYIVIGIVKFCSTIFCCYGCFGVWKIIDWARALANTDGFRWTTPDGESVNGW